MGNVRVGGINQPIYQQSSTAKHRVGEVVMFADGREFVYAEAGGALAAGKLAVAPVINAGFVNEAITSAVTAGTRSLTLTVTGGAAIAEDQLQNGQLQINDATSEGHTYVIESNSAVSATGTSIDITLVDPIIEALDTTSEFTLVPNPAYGVTHSATQAKAVGVPLIDVTSGNYAWLQKRGLGICLMDGTIIDGAVIQQSNGTAGAVEIYATGTITFEPLGVTCTDATGADTEYKPVVLNIA